MNAGSRAHQTWPEDGWTRKDEIESGSRSPSHHTTSSQRHHHQKQHDTNISHLTLSHYYAISTQPHPPFPAASAFICHIPQYSHTIAVSTASMRRQLLSLACGLQRRPHASVLTPLTLLAVCSHSPFYRPFTSTLASSPLLAPAETPTKSDATSSTATTPSTTPTSPTGPSIHKPQRLWTPDYVAPTKHIMNYLTQHGPQTRRTLYAIFGPTPTPASTPTIPSPTAPKASAAASSTAAAEAIAASPVVQSHPSCLRSKSHLTTLLQQLTRSGRVNTRRAPVVVVAGVRTNKKASGLFVYEMRDYATSWNHIRHEKQKGQKQRKKQQRLQEKAKEEQERAAIKERRRQRLEAGMTARS